MMKRIVSVGILTTLITVGFLMVGVSVGFLATGISVSTHSACACITVNDVVLYRLNWIDGLVQQYATEHNGLFPTYDELEAMVALDPHQQGGLTPNVGLSTRSFTFVPTEHDVEKIGYAVSDDRRDYVLLGVGLYERRIQFTSEHSLPAGHEFPVLRPRASRP